MPAQEGMVVLDVIPTPSQATQAPDLAAGRAARRQVRLVQRGDQRQAAADVHDPDGHVQGRGDDHRLADQTFALIRDLATDVSFNYSGQDDPPFNPGPKEADGTRRSGHAGGLDRSQEFRKYIECFLCQELLEA